MLSAIKGWTQLSSLLKLLQDPVHLAQFQATNWQYHHEGDPPRILASWHHTALRHQYWRSADVCDTRQAGLSSLLLPVSSAVVYSTSPVHWQCQNACPCLNYQWCGLLQQHPIQGNCHSPSSFSVNAERCSISGWCDAVPFLLNDQMCCSVQHWTLQHIWSLSKNRTASHQLFTGHLVHQQVHFKICLLRGYKCLHQLA